MHTIYIIIIIIKPKQKQQRKGNRRKKNEEEMHSFSRVKCDRETEKKTGVNNETKTLKKKQQNERVMCSIVLFFCRKGQFVSRKTHTTTAHKNAYHCPFQILEPKTHIHTKQQQQQQYNEQFLVLVFFLLC